MVITVADGTLADEPLTGRLGLVVDETGVFITSKYPSTTTIRLATVKVKNLATIWRRRLRPRARYLSWVCRFSGKGLADLETFAAACEIRLLCAERFVECVVGVAIEQLLAAQMNPCDGVHLCIFIDQRFRLFVVTALGDANEWVAENGVIAL